MLILSWRGHDRCFQRWIQPGGRGLMSASLPPPPRRIACRSPKTRTTIAGRGLDTPLSARNWTKQQQDNLMGRPLEFFLHTCAAVLAYWHNWLNSYEIGLKLVFMKMYLCGSKCVMTRSYVAIYSLNANIHVYVQVDKHEIYLYNVKQSWMFFLSMFKHKGTAVWDFL